MFAHFGAHGFDDFVADGFLLVDEVHDDAFDRVAFGSDDDDAFLYLVLLRERLAGEVFDFLRDEVAC